MIGSASWQQSGKMEHALGEAEYDAAQAKGYAEGLTDRVWGYKDSAVGAVIGNKAEQVATELAVSFFSLDLTHPFVPFAATQVTSARMERSSIDRRLTSYREVAPWLRVVCIWFIVPGCGNFRTFCLHEWLCYLC